MKLEFLDTTLLVVYLLGSVLLGVWLGRGQKTAADYMLGGRDLSWWVVLITIVATETSTVTYLSTPSKSYTGDMTFLQLPLGYVLGRIVVSFWLLPKYFAGEIFTAYQVLEVRFGGTVKRAASLLFLVTRTLADGLRLFLTAVVLQELTGLGMIASIAITGIVTLIYTAFGGMKAVVWTDVIQFFLKVGGAIAAFVALLWKLPGGFDELLRVGGEAGKLKVFEFGFDLGNPHTFWAGVVGGAVLSIGTHGVDQLMVQRYLCAKSLGHARAALVTSGFVVLCQFALFLLLGVGLYAFYLRNVPPAPIAKDHEFSSFIIGHLHEPPGLLGLVLGAVFAAAMSVLSGSLNSSATTFVKDLWMPLFAKDAPQARQLRMTKLATVLFGCLQMGVAVAGQGFQKTVIDNVLTIASITTGVILGVFFLGSLTKRPGQREALIGAAVGLLVVLALHFREISGVPFKVAWPWYALIGSSTTLLVGWVLGVRPRLPASTRGAA